MASYGDNISEKKSTNGNSETRTESEIIIKIVKLLEEERNIVFYKEKTMDLQILGNLTPRGNTKLVDLSINSDVENYMVAKYRIKKLPCLHSYNINIYNDKDLEENLERRNEAELFDYSNFLKNLVAKHKIFIFIKGTPERPECKFTRQLMHLFDEFNLQNGKDYNYYNILSNEVLRSLMKKINNWPTFPQLYFNGIFYGGLDVFKNLKNEGLLEKLVPSIFLKNK